MKLNMINNVVLDKNLKMQDSPGNLNQAISFEL